MKRKETLKRGLTLLGGGVTGLLLLASPLPANATSIWAEVGFNNPYYYAGQFVPNTASVSYTNSNGSTASATVDATAGTVKAFAHGVPNGQAYSDGGVIDSFTLKGAALGTPVSLTAYFTLDGTLSGNANLPYVDPANAYVSTYVSSSFSTGNDSFGLSARDATATSNCYNYGCSGFTIPVHRVGSITLNVIAGNPFDIRYSLGAVADWRGGGTSDFGHTAAISFKLPSGAWITSDGGFTQTAQSSVPEPSTLLLLGSGMTGFVAMRRFRKKG